MNKWQLGVLIVIVIVIVLFIILFPLCGCGLCGSPAIFNCSNNQNNQNQTPANPLVVPSGRSIMDIFEKQFGASVTNQTFAYLTPSSAATTNNLILTWTDNSNQNAVLTYIFTDPILGPETATIPIVNGIVQTASITVRKNT